jgi:hypothetical protein
MLEWIIGAVVLGGIANALGGDDGSRPTSVSPSRRPQKVQRTPSKTAATFYKAEPKERASDDVRFVSTTKLGPIVGIKAKPLLFDTLSEKNFIEKKEGEYRLTEAGRSFGRMQELECGSRFVTWDADRIAPELMPMRRNLLARAGFGLFHITHVDNLDSILADGLVARSAGVGYTDISNPSVQKIRAGKTDGVHGRSLHDYVPLYLNPRNAMLFQMQCEHDARVAILEIEREACLALRTVFAEGNAASEDSRFLYCLDEVGRLDWTRISAYDWREGNVKNLTTKRFMQSECLIPGAVPASRIKAVHVMPHARGKLPVAFRCKEGQDIPIKVSPELFFETGAQAAMAAR